jgi:hypothetical protein
MIIIGHLSWKMRKSAFVNLAQRNPSPKFLSLEATLFHLGFATCTLASFMHG